MEEISVNFKKIKKSIMSAVLGSSFLFSVGLFRSVQASSWLEDALVLENTKKVLIDKKILPVNGWMAELIDFIVFILRSYTDTEILEFRKWLSETRETSVKFDPEKSRPITILQRIMEMFLTYDSSLTPKYVYGFYLLYSENAERLLKDMPIFKILIQYQLDTISCYSVK